MQALKLNKITILSAFILLSGIFLFFPERGFSDSAKDQYLKADNCYKTLRNSEPAQKKETEWLNCISRYENIYRLYPESPWAPAGMYQAAQLNLALAKISGQKKYESWAADLLARLRNKYPNSAYNGKAQTLLRSIDTSGLSPNPPSVEKAARVTKSSPNNTPKTSPKVSKKVETKTTAPLHQYVTEEDVLGEAGQVTPEPSPGDEVAIVAGPPVQVHPGDSVVTDLRFWSNPEYTRIVINVDHERNYSHRLLNKDPDINVPFQRLYIDLEQTKLGKNVAEHTPINDNLLKQARAGQFLPHTVRVVVDIKSFENYKIFSLKDPFRIVIDVWGKGAGEGPPLLSAPVTTDSKGSRPVKPTQRITTDNLESSDIARQLALGVRTIVIDPGHGGSDPGAPGYYPDLWEKDIVLKIAKKLAVVLKDRLKSTVLLTRTEDKKLTLEERTAIANTKRADLFISLHCNAAKNKELRGLETYFLNLATDSQAIAVAARENATSEKNISDLDYILSDLMKHAKIKESTRLANIVHQSFVKGMKSKYSDIHDLGVKQAPFYVLLGARMPSILIEASFISNKTEAKRLMEDSYQRAIAESIADGIEKYIETTNPKQL